jgi:hypothetical protein
MENIMLAKGSINMSENCPFCQSTVNEGASVCACCGAFKSTPAAQNGSVSGGILFLWCAYAFITWMLFADDKNNFEAYLAATVFAIVGFIVLALITKVGCRTLWYRRN